MKKVLILLGSLRKDSYNRKLGEYIGNLLKEKGNDVAYLDLKDTVFPIYDGDIEITGLPGAVQDAKKLVEEASAVIIVSPEYNHSIPGGLKNAIDWISRGTNPFQGKAIGIAGVSTGLYGTVRMQPHLRQVLAALGALVPPQPQVMIGMGSEAFDENGAVQNEKQRLAIESLIGKVLESSSG